MYCLIQAYGLKPKWNSLKLHKDAQKKNCRNPGETKRCFNTYKMSMQLHLNLVNAHSYDDILGACWLCTDLVYFILTYLPILATVTLLIVGFYWNKPQVFK